MALIGPDWGSLVAQGRAKMIGVPWDEEELNALHELKIPVDYVRGGCVTLEQYNKVLGEGEKEKKLQYMKKEELLLKAEELGIEISEGSGATRNDLIVLIEEKSKKQETVSDAA